MNSPLKSISPFLGTVFLVVLQAVYAAYSDGKITLVESLNLVIVLGAAVATYIIPNVQGSITRWLKPIVTASGAGVLVIVNALQDVGVTQQTWIMVIIQVVVGLGVTVPTNQYAPLHAKREPEENPSVMGGGERLF